MALFSKIFSRENPNRVMRPLYDAIIAEGRQLHWYEQGGVADNIDGRFDMIAAIFSLIIIRLEDNREQAQNIAWLTELFVDDMEGQLRQIGIGDLVVGKHVGRIFGALGGRIGAYRDGLLGQNDLRAALVRNLYRGTPPGDDSLDHVVSKLQRRHQQFTQIADDDIIAGKLSAEAG